MVFFEMGLEAPDTLGSTFCAPQRNALIINDKRKYRRLGVLRSVNFPDGHTLHRELFAQQPVRRARSVPVRVQGPL